MAKEIKREVSKVTGNTRITYDDGSTKIIKANSNKSATDNGAVAPIDPTNPIYQAAVPSSDLSGGMTTEAASTNIKRYGTQKYDKNKGTYVATNLDTGKEEPMDMADFKKRHSEFNELYKSLNNGKELVDDLVSRDKATRTKAANWFQNNYLNEARKLKAKGINVNEWFDPKANVKTSPQGMDDKFGIHTWSAPALIPTATTPAATSTAVTTTPAKDTGVIAAQLEKPYVNPDYAPWWLQDQIKTAGAAMDFARIKKRMPWQATPNLTLADPTFYDPTRALAANTEMTNLAMQSANAFTNPQLAGALTLAAQAQGAGRAADIIAQNQGQNVGVANQFEDANVNRINTFANNRANAVTGLYDKNILASQNFDNSRNMAREKLRQSYIDAITNRRNTQNLNQMYPQFAVDPSLGGPMFFHSPRNMKGDQKPQQDFETLFTKYKSMGMDEPAKQARLTMGIQDPYDEINQYNRKQNPNPGYPSGYS